MSIMNKRKFKKILRKKSIIVLNRTKAQKIADLIFL